MKTGIISNLGYTWLALPRENILPLMLLEKSPEGFFSRIRNSIFGIASEAEALSSDIFDLFPKKSSRGRYPKCNPPVLSSTFAGEDLVSKSGGFIISGKEAIFGAVNAKLMGKLSKAKKLRYSFKEPKLIDSNIIQIEEHINRHQLNDKAAGFAQKAKNGQLFIITEVLQTNEFYLSCVQAKYAKKNLNLKF